MSNLLWGSKFTKLGGGAGDEVVMGAREGDWIDSAERPRQFVIGP